jgi:hypothetical protein
LPAQRTYPPGTANREARGTSSFGSGSAAAKAPISAREDTSSHTDVRSTRDRVRARLTRSFRIGQGPEPEDADPWPAERLAFHGDDADLAIEQFADATESRVAVAQR